MVRDSPRAIATKLRFAESDRNGTRFADGDRDDIANRKSDRDEAAIR